MCKLFYRPWGLWGATRSNPGIAFGKWRPNPSQRTSPGGEMLKAAESRWARGLLQFVFEQVKQGCRVNLGAGTIEMGLIREEPVWIQVIVGAQDFARSQPFQ
jgi:hypothetical protein